MLKNIVYVMCVCVGGGVWGMCVWVCVCVCVEGGRGREEVYESGDW